MTNNSSWIRFYDYIIIILALIGFITCILYYKDILTPNGEYGTKNYNPFHDFNTTRGIIIINNIKFTLFFGMSILGLLWIKSKNIIKPRINSILLLSFIFAILEWIELWYSSTFYYGEIRDKQGFGFPIMSLIFMIYFCIRIKLPKHVYRSGLIIGTILIYYWLFRLVQDDWNLNDNILLPWIRL